MMCSEIMCREILTMIFLIIAIIVLVCAIYHGLKKNDHIENLENLTQYNKNTPKASNERGFLYALAYHNVACDDNTYLNSVNYARDSNNMATYQYSCVGDKSIPKGQKLSENTSFFGNTQNNIVYLDRHDIKCPNGYGLSEFAFSVPRLLEKNGGDGLPGKYHLDNNPDDWVYPARYNYTCTPAKNFNNCVQRATDYSKNSKDMKATGDQTRAIVGQEIKCDSDQILTDIKMENVQPGAEFNRFLYTCCSETPTLETYPLSKSHMSYFVDNHATIPKSQKGTYVYGDVRNLANHNVNCWTESALNSAEFKTYDQNGLAFGGYIYKCQNSPDIGKGVSKSTDFVNNYNNTYPGNLEELNKDNIKCEAGYALSEFQYVVDSTGSKHKYAYTCVPVPNLSVCETYSTPPKPFMYNIDYLHHHTVECPSPQQVLTEMKFNVDGVKTATSDNRTMNYKYTCCSRNNDNYAENSIITKNNMNYLDRNVYNVQPSNPVIR